MEKMTLIAAVRKYMMLPGEGMQQIQAQWKSLTEKDKADFRAWFPAIGIEIEDKPAAPPVA
jgi:hypothetical protein